MDGKDLHRRIGGARHGSETRKAMAQLWRNQGPVPAASASDCVKAGRDPGRQWEGLRRAIGSPPAPPPR